MMKQYCRYCSHIHHTETYSMYCDAKGKRKSEASCKTVNKCKDFCFNPLDVFDFELKKTYKPRYKTDKGEQLNFKGVRYEQDDGSIKKTQREIIYESNTRQDRCIYR